MKSRVADEINALLPDLGQWNNGRGIAPLDRLFSEPMMDMPVLFSSLFWPRFVEFGPYVLREDFRPDLVTDWEKAGASRQGVEGALNTLDMLALLIPVGGEWNDRAEAQAVYLGRVLADIHRVKLARDFPDKRFTVEFWDGQQNKGDDISLSFWQSDEAEL